MNCAIFPYLFNFKIKEKKAKEETFVSLQIRSSIDFISPPSLSFHFIYTFVLAWSGLALYANITQFNEAPKL